MQKPGNRRNEKVEFVRKGEKTEGEVKEPTEAGDEKNAKDQPKDNKRVMKTRGGNRGKPPRRDRDRNDGDGERQQRPRFEYPVNWREDAQKDVTLETKIPDNPKGEALLAKPDPAKYSAEKDKIYQKMKELQQTRDGKIQEKRQYVDGLINANKGVLEQIKAKRGEYSEKFGEQINKLKKKKEDLIDKKKNIQNEIDQIKGKFSQKGVNRASLQKQLKELQDEHENTQLSAHREAKILEQMEKLKEQLQQIGPVEELYKKRDALDEDIDKASKELNDLYAKGKPLSEQIQALAAQLDSNRDEDSKRREKGKAEGDEKKEKPQRQKTDQEKEMDAVIDKLKEEREQLFQKIRDIDTKFGEEYLAYEKQQFEIKRLEAMRSKQQYLKRDEQRKKDAEEYAKRQKEDKEKELNFLKFKYQPEIIECGNLIKLLEEKLREGEKTEEKAKEAEKPEERRAKEDADDLKPLVGKKQQFKEEAKPLSKKQSLKKPPAETGPKKLFNDFWVITAFSKYEILMPNTAAEAEGTLKALREKVEHFEKLRAKELETAERKLKEHGEAAEKGEKPKEENAEAEEKKQKPAEPKKAEKVFKEEDFPQL